MPDYDSPWKEMLERYFPDFMAFFFPQAWADIDWTRGYESLDTELQQIVRDATLGRRRADKLVRVWRRNGAEQMVFLHTEVQGQPQEVFAKRMYVYHYRIFDRYDHPVVSLAILGDTSPTWRPTLYETAYGVVQCAFNFPRSSCAITPTSGRLWKPAAIPLRWWSWPTCNGRRPGGIPPDGCRGRSICYGICIHTGTPDSKCWISSVF